MRESVMSSDPKKNKERKKKKKSVMRYKERDSKIGLT